MTHIRNRLRPNTAYRLVSFGGPTLGPFAGTWLTDRLSWRWNMRTLPMISFVALCLYAFTIPESHRATLERKQKHKRVKALRKLVEQVGDDVEKTAPQHRQAMEDFAALEQHESRHSRPTLGQRMITSLQRPFVFLCTEPLIIVVCIYTAVLYGLLYGLLAGVRFAFIRVNGFSDLQTSWVYLAILLGFTIGAAFIGSWLQDKQFKAAWVSSKERFNCNVINKLTFFPFLTSGRRHLQARDSNRSRSMGFLCRPRRSLHLRLVCSFLPLRSSLDRPLYGNDHLCLWYAIDLQFMAVVSIGCVWREFG